MFLVGEEPAEHQFVVAIDGAMREQWEPMPELLEHPADLAARRRYADVVVCQPLHQRVFRDRVLLAYQRRCALCRLQHPELLDAAHIKEDAEGGEPVVPNGIAMCAIHHRAFDHSVLGIRPDYRIEVRADVLEEQDGPALLLRNKKWACNAWRRFSLCSTSEIWTALKAIMKQPMAARCNGR